MICEEVEHVCGFRTERDLVGDVHSYEVRERTAGESKWSTWSLMKYAVSNITAFTAVSAVRTAELHIFFMPERAGSVAAVAGFDINFCFVQKLHEYTPCYQIRTPWL